MPKHCDSKSHDRQPRPLRLPHLLLRQRRQLHRLIRSLEQRLQIGVGERGDGLRRLDCGFDLHLAGMGLGRQQPGRGQGNNGVFQWHDTLISFHDDNMPRKTPEAPSGSASPPPNLARSGPHARCARFFARPVPCPYSPEGVQPVHPQFRPAVARGVGLERGVQRVALVEAVARAQDEIGGRAIDALGRAVEPVGLAARPLHAAA